MQLPHTSGDMLQRDGGLRLSVTAAAVHYRKVLIQATPV